MTVASRPPGPPGVPVVGHLLDFVRDPLAFISNLAHRYGDVVAFRMGPEWSFLVNHPDHVRDVLVTHASRFEKGHMLHRLRTLLGYSLFTAEGEQHLRHRRMMQPSFHRPRIRGYAETMVAEAVARVSRWQADQRLDMQQEMMQLTLNVVCRCLFGTTVESEVHDIGQACEGVFGVFNYLLLPKSEKLLGLPLPYARAYRRARKRLDETIYRVIREHRTSGDQGDLLSTLLAARDEEGDGTGLTEEQIRDEVLTLFLAGHETTALGLSWALYLLSQNPPAQAALEDEVSRVLGGRPPTIEDLPNLVYTSGVACEALRLYPPVWMFGRQILAQGCHIGGYHLPADGVVLLSPWVTQRDPRYFEAPDEFRPERWRPDVPPPRYTWFPFGAGTRVCIGEQFARTEMVLVLAVLAQKVRLALRPEAQVVPHPAITLRLKHGLPMTVCLK